MVLVVEEKTKPVYYVLSRSFTTKYVPAIDSKESACNSGDLGSIPGSGRSPGGEHGNPLQYSCPENRMDRGPSKAAVHSIAQSRTQLN